MTILISDLTSELGRALGRLFTDNGTRVVDFDQMCSSGFEASDDHLELIIHTGIRLNRSTRTTTEENNLNCTREVVRFAKRTQTPLLMMSSILAQGPSPKNQPHENAFVSAPIDSISTSIQAAENLVVKGNLEDYCIFRLAIPYGMPGEFELFCQKLSTAHIVPMLPSREFSMIHIRDVYAACVTYMTTGKALNGIFHLSDGVSRSFEDMVNLTTRDNGHALRIPKQTESGWRISMAVLGMGHWAMLRYLSKHSWTSSPSELKEHLNLELTGRFAAYLTQLVRW